MEINLLLVLSYLFRGLFGFLFTFFVGDCLLDQSLKRFLVDLGQTSVWLLLQRQTPERDICPSTLP